ncbi:MULTISPECIES: hypothetical protein [Moorena]|nr:MULTISPECIES: hypothetical protein [Moorena]
MANAPRVTYGQGIARHHGKRTITVLEKLPFAFCIKTMSSNR